MTGEVIKTETTSLLSLSLNMNHAANLDMWMCRHIWFSGEEAFASCLTLWLSLSGRNHWNADRGVWIMDCPTVAQRSTHSAIPSDSHSRCSLNYTSPLFNPREVLARGQPSLSVWVTEYVRVCLCVSFLCGNVGSACSPRAMLINALQTKCSPFSLFCALLHSSPSTAHLSSLLSGHCWERRRRWCWETGWGAGGKYTNKAEYERKYTSGLRQCWALPLSPSCLLCLMLRAINILNSELRLRLSHTSHANHVHNPPTFTIFNNNRIQDHCQAHLATSIQMPISRTHSNMTESKPTHSLQVFSLGRIYRKIPTVFIHSWNVVTCTHTHIRLSASITL